MAAGLSCHDVGSLEVLLGLLDTAKARRASGHHKLNMHSSRSHMVECLAVTTRSTLEGGESTARLTMVDLAGSERIKKTGSTGMTAVEAKHINKTLSALGNVMEALAKKAAHVPFRDSKLTRMLSSSFGAQCKLLMFVCVSPASEDASETMCSLKFASRCMEVATKRQGDVQTRELQRLQLLVERQREELSRLREQLASATLV